MTARRPEAMPLVKKPAVRVLAIDDEPEFLNIIAEALAQENLEVLTSSDAAHDWNWRCGRIPRLYCSI